MGLWRVACFALRGMDKERADAALRFLANHP
jgi:hypothetical protein